MNKKCRTIFSLVLCGIFLFSAGCRKNPLSALLGESTSAPVSTPVVIQSFSHENVTLSDMAYVRPDTDDIAARLDSLMADITAGKPVEELINEYGEILRLYNDADSQMSLAYLYYAFDVTNDYYQKEYTNLQSILANLDLTMTDVSIALFSSSPEAENAARTAFGTNYVDTVYSDEALNSDQIRELEDREQQLISDYDRLAVSYTVQENGKDWTYDELASDSDMDSDVFLRLYNAYYNGFNREAGELFLELVSLRRQIAAKLGYGSYAAYRYDVYGRDYTVTDAQQLHAAVKKYIVPIYMNMQEDDDLYYLYGETFDKDVFFEQLANATMDFSPDVNEAFLYMRNNRLYDFDVSPNKMTGSFTTYITSYKAPFLFTQWNGNYGNLTAVIHELGHFTNYYHNPSAGWSAGDSLDLAEVDSQGLELLMTAYYDTFFGEYAGAARQDVLSTAMYSLITGCMEDEFQQTVYASPNMTLDEMNEAYAKLAGEYGFTQMYGYTGKEWVMIPHTFQTPMYYISYAVSMTTALELFRLMADGQTEQARQIYHTILHRAPYAAYREVTSQSGLGDAFQEGTIRQLAELLKANT